MSLPRGIRNNNPGNIRKGEKWQGLSEIQYDSSFCVFVSPEWGIRALCRILRNYQKKYGLNDVRSIINRFAPPIENDTDSYVYSVCKQIGVSEYDKIKLSDNKIMLNLLKAIIKHENGIQPYSDEEILKGIKLEGK